MPKDISDLSKNWHRSFYTLWLGSFITDMEYSMTIPLISLFISDLGDYSELEINLYSDLVLATTFIAQAIVSPFQGSLADQRDHQLTCMRASGVMALTITLTGLTPNVIYIVIMRFIQGSPSSYISNTTALVAGEAPHKKSGWTMNQMMTTGTADNLVGPLLGGALSSFFGNLLGDIWDYRIPFFITGLLMFMVFSNTTFFVREHSAPVPREKMEPMQEIMASLPSIRLVVAMFTTTMLVQSATMLIDPIVPLYVRSMMPGSKSVALITRIVAVASGSGTMVAASKIGHRMDEIGPLKVSHLRLIIGATLFVPMALANSPRILAGLRSLLGIASATMMSVAQTVLTLNAPSESFGRIFNCNQSLQAIGAVPGPFLGSGISGFANYEAVFWVTGFILLPNFLIILIFINKKNTPR